MQQHASSAGLAGFEGVGVDGLEVDIERGFVHVGLAQGVLFLCAFAFNLLQEVHLRLLGLVLVEGAFAGVDVKLLLEVAGVIAGEVVTVVLHAVGSDGPDFVLALLLAEDLGGVVLDELGGVLEELDLHLGDGLDLLFVQLQRVQRGAVVLQRLQLVDHEPLLLDVAVRRALLLLVQLPLVDLRVLQVLDEAGHLAGPAAVEGGDAAVGIGLLVGEVAVDDVLAERHEVQLGTGELGVARLAVGALEDLELVELVLALVAQLAVELEVQVALAQHVDQPLVAEAVDDGVDDGLEAEGRGGLGDEVGVEEEGLAALADGDAVNDEAAVLAVVLTREEAELAGLEDEEVVVTVDAEDELLGMRDLGLDDLREGEERLLHHVVEEEQVLEDGLVGLLEVVDSVGGGQLLHELHLLLDVEQLLDVHVLLDVVVDLPGELLVDAVLVCQLLEDLQVLAALDVLRADVGDERPHAADVVGEDHAADGLDEDHAARLLVGHRHDVPEADRQHHRGPPVVGPDVLLVPLALRDLPRDHPVLLRVDIRHLQQDDRQDVREAEVEQQHLHQRPVLLVVVVLDEVHLQLLQLLHAVWELQQRDQPQARQRRVGRCDVHERHRQVRHVEVEPLPLVAAPDLAVGRQLPAQAHPHGGQVDHDFEEEEEEADDLDDLEDDFLLELGEDEGEAVDKDGEHDVDEDENAEYLLVPVLELEALLVEQPRALLSREVEVDGPRVHVVPLQLLHEGLLDDVHLLSHDHVLQLPPLLPLPALHRLLQPRGPQVLRMQRARRLIANRGSHDLPRGDLLALLQARFPVPALRGTGRWEVEGSGFERGPPARLLLRRQYGYGAQLRCKFLDVDQLFVLEAARQTDVGHRNHPFEFIYIYSTNLGPQETVGGGKGAKRVQICGLTGM